MPNNLLKHEYPGFYVLIEGTDGSGKSELARELTSQLDIAGMKVTSTAEPMNIMYGRMIRNRFASAGDDDRYEMGFAFAADRQYHQNHVVIPALKEGRVVVQDRGAISTLVYQGPTFGSDVHVLNTNVLAPNLVVLLEADEESFRERRKGGSDMYERMPYLSVQQQYYLHVVSLEVVDAVRIFYTGKGRAQNAFRLPSMTSKEIAYNLVELITHMQNLRSKRRGRERTTAGLNNQEDHQE